MTALKLVLAGETYLPPSLLDGAPIIETYDKTPQAGEGGFSKLSAREAEALRLLMGGKTNKEIAIALNLQEVTVKVHLRSVYRKIKAANRADAVRIAMQQGWR